MPWSVKISSSRLCGRRPSMKWTRLHALLQGADRAGHLRRRMPLSITPFFFRLVDLADLQRGDERGRIGGVRQQAGHVASCRRAGAPARRWPPGRRDQVGVHVVGLAVDGLGHRRDDGDKAVGDFFFDELDLHLGHFADIARSTDCRHRRRRASGRRARSRRAGSWAPRSRWRWRHTLPCSPPR